MKKVRIVLAIVLAMSIFTFIGCGDNSDKDMTDEGTTVETTVETTNDTLKDDAEDLKDDAKDMVDDDKNTTETTVKQ